MSNSNHLKQERKARTFQVNENPLPCSILVSDDSNPFATPEVKYFTGRISHDGAGPFFLTSNPSGLSSNLGRYLLVDYTVDFLKEGDIINNLWKLGPIDPLTKFGGVHGYQTTLTEAI